MSVRSKSLFTLVALLVVGALAVMAFALNVQAAPARQDATATPSAAELPPAFDAAAFNPARTITVVGRGEVKVQPDIATTTVGVDVQAGTVEAAVAQAQARMDAVLDALKGLGIASADIQTSNFSINFERSMGVEPVASTDQPESGEFKPVPGFYRVSNMVTVTIRDLDRVSEVLDTAVKSGANNIWGLSFGLDDTDALEVQARAAAIRDARERAESLAELNGVVAGGVVSISEIIGNQNSPLYMAAEGRGGGGMPAQPGEVTFSTQIQVIYAIESSAR
ncbi:MAG: 26 kDa periplasmic immunogenic protein precursor [Chloroflexi bacterium ADurb.Bin325]|nr:MAG: 26 kDa periplasmic immunogenic protein precursor [Chloroflexi bacterium ADurb.Bin325]